MRFSGGGCILGYMNRVKGFTIVELLVVIVVIGILAAITIVAYTGISGKAVTASLQSDLTSAKKQLALYQVDNGSFPTSLDGSNCPIPTDAKYCLKPSSNNVFIYSPMNNAIPQFYTLSAINGSLGYFIKNDSSPVLVGWVAGIIATVLANKWVYNVDYSGSTYSSWGPNPGTVNIPQGLTGLDTTPYDTKMTLVSNNTVDFTTISYPARQACKVLGGRLPNVHELQAIYTGRAYYGNNFRTSYWSATEENSTNAWSVAFDGNGYTYNAAKSNGAFVRCVKD